VVGRKRAVVRRGKHRSGFEVGRVLIGVGGGKVGGMEKTWAGEKGGVMSQCGGKKGGLQRRAMTLWGSKEEGWA